MHHHQSLTCLTGKCGGRGLQRSGCQCPAFLSTFRPIGRSAILPLSKNTECVCGTASDVGREKAKWHAVMIFPRLNIRLLRTSTVCIALIAIGVHGKHRFPHVRLSASALSNAMVKDGQHAVLLLRRHARADRSLESSYFVKHLLIVQVQSFI